MLGVFIRLILNAEGHYFAVDFGGPLKSDTLGKRHAWKATRTSLENSMWCVIFVKR
jgi:hypothetical protein